MNLTGKTRTIDLSIGGMTCAACSSRIERRLNRVEGVSATVNLATEKARVEVPAHLSADDIIAVVRKTGYTAEIIAGLRDAPEPLLHTGPIGIVPEGMPPTTAASMQPSTPASAPRIQSTQPDDVALTETGPLTTFDAAMSKASLAARLIVAACLAVPVVVLAMVPQVQEPLGELNALIQLGLTLPIVLWAAYPFHRAASINARYGASTMDTLVSLGVWAAFIWSVIVTFTSVDDHLYYEVAAVVPTFLLAGRYAEQRARRRGGSAITALMDLAPPEVSVLRGTEERRIPTAELQVSDIFVVRPGEKVATDGVVLKGESALDCSLVTGESLPVEARPGTEVVGGTLNTHGLLTVRATRVGAETALAQITALVETAQTGKAPVQRLADRVSAVFVPAVLVIATLTFIGWLLLTDAPIIQAAQAAVTVLIIACPCALGLATPTALLAGTGRGAELGVLIKGPEILESTRRINTVVLDKTGTLTTGRTRVTGVHTVGRLTSTAALQAAASVEAGSEHPIGVAIVEAAKERRLDIKPITDFEALPGQGARATILTTQVTVGKAELFAKVPAELKQTPNTVGTAVYVGWDGAARAVITVADHLRDTSPEAIRRLRRLGLTPYLLTGDNMLTAQAVAAETGIDASNVIAEVMPAAKHAAIVTLQSHGRVVAMVGDGINDAAALARADLGLAMGSGTDVAMESADIVLVRTDLGAVADAIGLSRATLSVIKQNLTWAFAYNVLAIPLAAMGKLNPMIAGGAMALSSVMVVLNSLRLRTYGAATVPGGSVHDGSAEKFRRGVDPAPAVSDEPDAHAT